MNATSAECSGATAITATGTAVRENPPVTPRTRDAGRWHCARRGCPGGHLLPDYECGTYP